MDPKVCVFGPHDSPSVASSVILQPNYSNHNYITHKSLLQSVSVLENQEPLEKDKHKNKTNS